MTKTTKSGKGTSKRSKVGAMERRAALGFEAGAMARHRAFAGLESSKVGNALTMARKKADVHFSEAAGRLLISCKKEQQMSGRKWFHEAALRSEFRHGAFDDVVIFVSCANPIERVELEREGVPALIVKDMADEMKIPAVRMYDILGVPKATAERRVTAGKRISGAGGHAAVAMLTLIGEVQAMLSESTSDDAAQFDAAEWLGQWIERPQPALGGKKPADLLDTPTGIDVVSRSLGSILSGAYQ